MVVSEVLEFLGLGGGLILLVSAAVGLYHVREGMVLLGRVRTWVMAAGLFVLVLLAGEAGLIPGLDPQLGTVVDWLIDSVTVAIDVLVDGAKATWGSIA